MQEEGAAWGDKGGGWGGCHRRRRPHRRRPINPREGAKKLLPAQHWRSGCGGCRSGYGCFDTSPELTNKWEPVDLPGGTKCSEDGSYADGSCSATSINCQCIPCGTSGCRGCADGQWCCNPGIFKPSKFEPMDLPVGSRCSYDLNCKSRSCSATGKKD